MSPTVVAVRSRRRPATWSVAKRATAAAWAFAYLYLFRRVVVALALLGAGAAWVAELPWLAAAGLAIATGEWLESSYYIGVLRWGQRRGTVPVAGRAGA